MFSRNSVAFTGLLFVALCVGMLSSAEAATKSETPSSIGQKVKDFTLIDHNGNSVSLSDYANSKLVAVVFLGTECPLAQAYGLNLSELQRTYPKEKVQILGIDSNRQDSLKDLKGFVTQQEINFPMLKDKGGRAAHALGAERTPEVFLLDQERRVRYYGRIDDQYSPGVSKASAEATYLVDAISELLNGKSVGTPTTKAEGCKIGFPPEVPPTGDITYTKDIAKIFNKHCVSCHREGEIAPFTMGSYEDVAGWEDMILEVIDQKRMPPWSASAEHGDFENDPSLSPKEIELIETWVLNGIPEGDPADLEAAPPSTQGWQMDEPEFMVYMRENEKPYTVPAKGVVDYQHWVVDPEWDEDMYIVQAEARPGNRAVVHHIIAYVIPPEDWDDEKKEIKNHRQFRMLAAYAPGLPPTKMPKDVAFLVKAGSKIQFELHYTPNGKEQTDLSKLGLRFTDKANVKKLAKGGGALNTHFALRANKKSPEHVAFDLIERPSELISMSPHMHLRGKSFRYEFVTLTEAEAESFTKERKIIDESERLPIRSAREIRAKLNDENGDAKKKLATELEKQLDQLEALAERRKSLAEKYAPAQDREILLDVPNFDFNWQLRYELRNPKKLPRNTLLICTATFDNSSRNRALLEEQRQQFVIWGEQSWEEMLIGFYVTIPVEEMIGL